jgi:hypothetical protein
MAYEQIRERNVELRASDHSLKIFGSEKHGYVSTPVDPAEVDRFEAELGTPLPAEFRNFLLELGYGAGPYYGIWSPQESPREVRMLIQDYMSEERKEVHANWPFPLTSAELDSILAQRADGKFCPAEHDWPCSGCVAIRDQGCTFWSVLILKGEFAGRVWDLANFVGYSGQLLPATCPPGIVSIGFPALKLEPLPTPPTFGEWYRGCIDRCMSDLTESAKCFGNL